MNAAAPANAGAARQDARYSGTQRTAARRPQAEQAGGEREREQQRAESAHVASSSLVAVPFVPAHIAVL